MTYFRVAFQVYYKRLQDMFSQRSSDEQQKARQIKWILTAYKHLHENWPILWDEGPEFSETPPNLKFLKQLFRYSRDVAEYFRDLASRPEGQRIAYLDLLTSHLLHAPSSFEQAVKRVQEGKARDSPVTGDYQWRGEAMHCYFDYIPRHADHLRTRGCQDEDAAFEAWCMMMFRGFLWRRYHRITTADDRELPLPHRFYASKIPVYIG